ncbi:MAG: hypothetical protein M3R00_03885 [Pseudomonadota bacterium]|nr:hypothetical protein [Pseudomonadota bacterium]
MILSILGIGLIAAGAYVLYYNGYFFNKNKKIAQVGDIKVTSTKPLHLSPSAGGWAIGIGVVLLIIGMI